MKHLVGAVELIALPDLGIEALHARVDSGAATSSLHAEAIQCIEKNGKPWLKFKLPADFHHHDRDYQCEAPLLDTRRIKSSNGQSRHRYVISSTLVIGDLSWPAELTLTDRSEMTYAMLLGREAMLGRLVIDPGLQYVGAQAVPNL